MDARRHDPVLSVERLTVVHPRHGARLRRRGVAGGVTAVDDVSLRVADGEVVALIGESGSGKTTLSLAAAGLGRITSGTVRVLDEQLSPGRTALRRRRADVQMVFQDPHASLDPRQSVRRGLAELRTLHPGRTGWTGHEGLLERVGLPPELLDRLPHEMSGGQAQRVAIARALYLQPALLVADEPTSALDVSVQAQILTLLLRLVADRGFALLLVTHDLSIVRHVADRIHVMQRGRLVESGVTEDVLTGPTDAYTRTLIDAIPGKQFVGVLESPNRTEREQ